MEALIPATWKPCPFCGSQDIDRIKAMAMYKVVCNKCEAHSHWYHTMEEAWRAWNMRDGKEPEKP